MSMNYNRVTGLKFLSEYFPELFDKNRIELHFVNNKTELNGLNFNDEQLSVLVLKRSGNGKCGYISDLLCKDNRFFKSLAELKEGAKEFRDEFVYCVECHRFGIGEDYYTDRLAIVQLSTMDDYDVCDNVSLIPSRKKNVKTTRDSCPYAEIVYPYYFNNIYKINFLDINEITENDLNYKTIDVLAKNFANLITKLKKTLEELKMQNVFQMIVRIDKHLNLLPIDFRTADAWSSLQKTQK